MTSRSSSSSAQQHKNDYLDSIGEPHEYVQSDTESDDEHDAPIPSPSIKRKESHVGVYGDPSLDRAESAFRNQGKEESLGLKWHCQIYSDSYRSKKHCLPSGKLKSRRPTPQVRASDFLKSLVRTKDGRWVFSGALNGWPALTNLEVISITGKRRHFGRVKRYWTHSMTTRPSVPTNVRSVRATLRAPAWSETGWSKKSPGLVLWYAPCYDGTTSSGATKDDKGQRRTFFFGTNILDAVSRDPLEAGARCVRAHHYAHRYANDHESLKDKLTYHSIVLLEWSHGKFCTVVELAWRNGLGGYKGRSNWVEDKNAARPELYSAMDDALKAPWNSSRSEIRCIDMGPKIKSRDDFDAYVRRHTGKGRPFRFYRPECVGSGDVRLSFRSRAHVMRYLLNYIRNRIEYTEFSSNCQTFAADFFGFLVCDREVVPYAAVNRIGYVPARHMFLYDPPEVSVKEAAPTKRALDWGECWEEDIPEMSEVAATVATSVVGYAIVATVALLAYENVGDCDFVFDDHLAIRTNPDVDVARTPRWTDTLRHDFWGKDLRAPDSHKSWRPITILSFRWNHYFSEMRASHYHATNAALHALVSIAVVPLERLVFSSPSSSSSSFVRSNVPGIVAGLVFAVHPVHTEAVTGVVGRGDVLCALFLLGAFFAHRGTLHATALALVACATLSKETGLAGLGLLVVDDVATMLLLRERPRALVRRWIAYVAFFFGYVLLRSHLTDAAASLETSELVRKTENPFAFARGTSWFLSTAYLHARYAYLLVWPAELCAEYSFDCVPLVETWTDPRNALSIACYAGGLALLGRALLRRDRGTIVCLAFIVIPMLPASNIFMRVGTLIAERLLYVPSIGYCLLLSRGLDALGRDGRRRLFWACLWLGLSVMVFRTRARNVEWRTDEKLFESAVRVCPRSSKMQLMLGQIRLTQGRVEDALARFERSRDIDPDYCDVDLKFGDAYIARQDLGRAVHHYRRALDCKFTTKKAWTSLTTLWGALRRARPDNGTLYQEMAETMHAMGGHHVEASMDYYREAAVLALRRGEATSSDKHLVRALEILSAAPIERCDMRYWRGKIHLARASLDESRRAAHFARASRAFKRATACNDTVVVASDELLRIIETTETDPATRDAKSARTIDRLIEIRSDLREQYASAASDRWSRAAGILFARGRDAGDAVLLRRAGRFFANAVANVSVATCSTLRNAALVFTSLERAGVSFASPSSSAPELLRLAEACEHDQSDVGSRE
eukprot:g540.t1